MNGYQPIADFNVKCFLDTAAELLRHDETLRALWLLQNLPAYYRDNPPHEIVSLRREIQKRMATGSFYATSKGYELSAHDDSIFNMHKSLRGMMIIKEVEMLNSQGFVPHIADYAPGEYFLSSILHLKNLKFTYFPIYVNGPSHAHYYDRFKDYLVEKPNPSEPKIFFAGEIIEHLHCEEELRFDMERAIGLADLVHISTPCYTFDTGCRSWLEKQDLGHLRAYTPLEFTKTVGQMFPEYAVITLQSQILHARGVLKTTKFASILSTIDKNILE